jgi:4-amino-4-deoxy-L-arabinose transferase-like glycosyltransferase
MATMNEDERDGASGPATRRWIAAAALLGLGLRLAFGLLYWTDQPLTRDELEYLSLARSLTAGHGYVYDSEVLRGPVEPFGRAPGYPVFLTLVGGGREVVSAVPTSVKVAQSIVGAAGVLLIAVLAWRLGGPQAARAAAAIAAIYPPLVWVSAYAYSEAVFWPFGLLIVWSIDRLTPRHPRIASLAFTSGILTGAGVLLRAALTTFLPLAALWIGFRRGLRPAILFAAGVAIVITPWAIRNYGHHGRFVIVASDGGVTFWTGNNPLATGEGDMAANPRLKDANNALRARYPDLNEEQMEPIYYRDAFAWIRANPGAWLALEVKKLFYLFVPIGPSYTLHSTRYLVASVVSYGALLALAIFGVYRLGPDRARTPGLWLVFASAVGVALVFFPQERFRIPVIDPTLIVCAAALWKGRSETVGGAKLPGC